MIWQHNLRPFILGPWRLGPIDQFGIRWYSLPYILGFVAIYAALRRAVMSRRIPNADEDRLEEAALLLIVSIIVGGRIGYFVLNEPGRLLHVDGWIELPQVWHGGMAFFGAVAMLFTTEYFYCRHWRLGFWHGADRIMWIFAVALGFGRIANFINGELYGIPTNGHWGVVFPQVPDAEWIGGVNVPRHPVQLYSAVSHWALGLLLLYLLWRRPRREFDRVPGFTCFWFLGGYGFLRFATDFWRHETIWIWQPYLNGGQALSLALMVAALIGARIRVKLLKERGGPLDWYPPEGVSGELPAECHAWLDAYVAAGRQRPEPEQPLAKDKPRPKIKSTKKRRG
jgi:phosphatidylglycerol:prolipoprotein diacylglycerol transferase